MNLSDEILKGLRDQFKFKKVGGDWLQGGLCPQCGKAEAFTAAVDPKIVRCGRSDRCGWEDSVRNLLPDLFEDWSKRHPQTEENPNAAADAYLQHERGLDLRLLRGTYTQELYRDFDTGQTGATVRFPFADSYWERIIDKPGRFGKKAHFKKGGKWSGHCWMPNGTTFETLAQAKEIWITEGIFDAVALTMVHRDAVSNMSTNPYPEHFLKSLADQLQIAGRSERPRLVFAFDVGAAGVTFCRKHIARARREGWVATAAQVRPDGEGTKLDWNDLLLRHQNWQGDEQDAPLSDHSFDEYLHNGAITIAETPRDKARLIVERAHSQARAISSFDFRHGNRLWWCRLKEDEDGGKPQITIQEIANCAFRLLYRERDEVADETNFFLRIDFPFENLPVKARFSSAACANSGEFKKRLMAFAGTWAGTGEQLDRIIKNQTRRLKVVEPIPFTGYSPDHQAYILGDLAVKQGRVHQINAESYFDFGKHALKPRSSERMLAISYDPDQLAFDWMDDLWTAYGPKGVAVLAFFTMSLFAVQIRKRQQSLAFLEITGPPGSGKSTLVEFCWKLLGREGYEGFDPNKGTRAFLSRSFVKVSNLPVGLIEGGRETDKRSHAQQFDYNELLVLFNGRSPRGIGRKSGGYETEEPPFYGSIYLMQNERIDAIPAVLERLISLSIDKQNFSDAGADAAERLANWPVKELSGTIIHLLRQETPFLQFFADRVKHHRNRMRDRIEKLSNGRIILNHSQLAATIDAMPKMFPSMRPEWIEQTIALIDDLALDRQNSTSADHPVVADFWDKVEYLMSKEPLDAVDNGTSVNRHRKAEQFIAINLPDFESRCRNAGILPPRMDELKKLLRGSKSRKFLAKKTVNPRQGKGQDCWIFERSAEERGRLI